MALHHLRDMLQALHHVLVHAATFQGDTHIGTRGVTQALRVDIEATTHDYIPFNQMLYPLVNGSPRHITLGSHILESDSCIL